MRRQFAGWLLAVGTMVGLASPLPGQEPDSDTGAGSAVLLRGEIAAAIPQLKRNISLRLEGVTLERALETIARQADLPITYNDAILPREKRVWLTVDDIRTDAALERVLRDSGLQLLPLASGQLVVVRRHAKLMEALQGGTVVGRVTDGKTNAAIGGATVVVEGTSRSGTTGTDGRYRIAGLAPGTYTLRGRYIGYAPATATATVSADQEATADLALEKSAQRLDEVVTTGTLVPTEVRALPTPVSVISDSLIAQQRPHTVQELFRQTVPTAVSWDYPDRPGQTSFAVRGTSSLHGLSGQMKVFVDGIETVDPTRAAIDPGSIERIEVVRGPQAAAIYGSDAAGGVIQVFTKRGSPNTPGPLVNAQAALGVVQTPYAGYGGVIRQTYTAGIRGGGPDVSYNFGAGYSHTGDYIPGGDASSQSNPSVYGGMRYTRGVFSADVTGRYYVLNNPFVASPSIVQTGDPYFSKPLYQPYQYQNQTLGARLGVAATPWWQHTITVGLDRFTFDAPQTLARLTSPADTFLSINTGSEAKTSIGYNTSIRGSLSASVSGSFTAGFDHYSLPTSSWYSYGALTTSGTIQTDPNQPVSAERNVTNNTGYFAQGQVGFANTLFLTGGIRAEQNTNFGDSLGTPVSPRVGASLVKAIGGATLKVRGSWGRAIRAPSPGYKSAARDPFEIILANPQIGPERQQGWDAGADALFGARGSLSVTYYDQTADNLIQFVQLAPGSPPTYQFQNVARVKNRGVEVEAALTLGMFQLQGQYGYARARIDALGPNYKGDLRVGDQTLHTPEHTAGASVAVTPLSRTTITAGLTYVGSWHNYDVLAEERCFSDTGPCQPGPGLRSYLIAYPGIVKVNATLSQELTPFMSGFLSVDNFTNNESPEVSNDGVVMGRITTVGISFHH